MATTLGPGREPPSATVRVARFRLHFRQIALPELEAAGLLARDADRQEITAGPRFEEKWGGRPE